MLQILLPVVLALSSALLALPALSLQVTLNPASTTSYQWLFARDGDNTTIREGYFQPPTVPFSGSDYVESGGSNSYGAFDLSNNGFSFTFNHSRAPAPSSDPSIRMIVFTKGHIRFSVDVDTPYDLSGMYSAIDPRGRQIELRTHLREAGGAYLVNNYQDSRATINESFVLGESRGDRTGGMQGSLTGTLLAGQEYEFEFIAVLGDLDLPTTQAATATGSVQLALIPEPSTAILVGMGLVMLGLGKK